MRIALLFLFASLCFGQRPTFTPDSIVASPPILSRSALGPGSFATIYGIHLGPFIPWLAQSARSPPPVTVLVNGRTAKVHFASDRQLNVILPDGLPENSVAEFVVAHSGLSSEPVRRVVHITRSRIVVPERSYVGEPVWLAIKPPLPSSAPRYPFSAVPNDFGCHDLELRRNSNPMRRRIHLPLQGGVVGGIVCGSVAFTVPAQYSGRLPLHLLYRLDEPGDYEVRYAALSAHDRMPYNLSEWTPLVIQPQRNAIPPLPPPGSVNELLEDYLPSLLARRDPTSRAIVGRFVKHPDKVVSYYATIGLGYWPPDVQ